jgi:hypothetical protein
MAGGISNTQIYNEIKDISVSIARIDGRMSNVESASAKLMRVVIDGNGVRPLTEQVKELQDAKKAADCVKQEKKEIKTKWDLRMWAIVMLFIGQVVILIFK